ncbi:MAG: hypothetical protein JXR95_09635 [Deltaproteobacteria bacterium]|nr:hypothetical protein [Deltaproteobacteria bacterium]
MIVFDYWRRTKEFILKHEKLIWVGHSVWALTFGILVIIFFHGDFGQVRKLTLYLMALLLLLIVFDRVGQAEIESGRQKKGIKLVLNYVMKNMYQGLYFFMIPFYWEASVLDERNFLFTIVVGVLALLSTQDLIFDNWLMENKFLRAGFYSFCLFASFDLLLPLFLPLPTNYTLPLAAFGAVFGFVILHYPKLIFKKGYLRWVILGGIAVAGGCYTIRSFVPPAPYKIGISHLGTMRPTTQSPPLSQGAWRIHTEDFEEKTFYMSHILESPVYPRDNFYHLWKFEGKTVKKARVFKQKISKDTYLLWSSLSSTEVGSMNLTGNWHIILNTAGDQMLKKRGFMVVK